MAKDTQVMGGDVTIVVDYGDSLLRETDLSLLTGSKSAWLNDNLIGFYFEYLSREVFPLQEGSPRIKFFSPQVTQCLKMHHNPEVFIDTSDGELSSFDWLFFAVNNSTSTTEYVSGSHWSLLVYSKGDGAFYHLDTSAGASMNLYAARSLVEKLKALIQPLPPLRQFPCKTQANGYDCGLHTLVNARLIGEYIAKGNYVFGKNEIPTASPAAAEAMRETLAELIKTTGDLIEIKSPESAAN